MSSEALDATQSSNNNEFFVDNGAGRKKQGNKAKKKDQFLGLDGTQVSLSSYLKDFAAGSEPELLLPDLTKGQRKELHNHARRLGLNSRSYGPEHDRILCITRSKGTLSFAGAYKFDLSALTRKTLLDMLPIFRKELLKAEADMHSMADAKNSPRWQGEPYLTGLGHQIVPPPAERIPTRLNQDKCRLPIYCYRENILSNLAEHSVFIINGETGSGKSTQVPQYILQHATQNNRACRIIVTQPRRVAAVSIAQRVAQERGERVGNTVGYQIRLESRMRRTSNLIYTTSGCLLRSIMANKDELFHNITHLIIDEIHERDKYTDFTLIALKKHIQQNKHLRVILMSATMNIPQLSTYFDNCPVLNVPGQGYDVKIFHLEDILYYTGYRTNLMQRYYNSQSNAPNIVPEGIYAEQYSTTNEPVFLNDRQQQHMLDVLLDQLSNAINQEDVIEIFDQIQYYIESEGMHVDAAHSDTGITPLMAACRENLPHYVDIFLKCNANPLRRDINNLSAAYYASLHLDIQCAELLKHHCSVTQNNTVQMPKEINEKHRLLNAYQSQFNDDNDVDHDLILSLLEGLYRSSHPGAIMVFLPGYNDIVQQRDLITCTFPHGTYRICIMHGQMDSQDQCAALRPSTLRKIILSTNIGQTSITIPDLAYIIDSGKVKMKTFDSITETSHLNSVWISQSDANQRAGRAGRTQNGVCYRLYSMGKYESMPKFCCPEFMRISLTEICLYAKTLETKMNVEDYLSFALNPPSKLSIRNAVKKLKILGVFDEEEGITDLGRHLVEIPLDVQLGKCLLFSIYMRCWEPILTIVAFHSIKDPFILPTDRALQGHASFQRKALSANSLSDQRGILELYNHYMAVRHNRGKAADFCAKYFLSTVSMELLCATRSQIRQLIMRKFNMANLAQEEFNWNLVRLCLVVGFYPNVACLDRSKCVLVSGIENCLQLQRTSALTPPGMKNLKNFIKTLPHDWLVFFEKAQLGRLSFVNMNTMVPPIMIALCCSWEHTYFEDDTINSNGDNNDCRSNNHVDDVQFQDSKESQSLECTSDITDLIAHSLKTLSLDDANISQQAKAILQLDDWIKFELDVIDARLLLTIRALLHARFMTFLRYGSNDATMTATNCIKRLLNSLQDPLVNNDLH